MAFQPKPFLWTPHGPGRCLWGGTPFGGLLPFQAALRPRLSGWTASSECGSPVPFHKFAL